MSLNIEFSKTIESALMTVLQAHASDVSICGGSKSNVNFGPGSHPGYAEFRGGWFRIDVPLTGRDTALPTIAEVWEKLARAGDLRGVKFVMPVDSQQLAVRAEFPIHGIDCAEVGIAEARARNACTAIATALQASNNSAAPAAARGDAAADDTELQDRLSESGWQFETGSSGRLCVDLEVAYGSFRADVKCLPGGVCLSVDVLMTDCQGATEVCRYALGIFLLRAGSEIRMAGAAACREAGQIIPRFQIALPPEPGAAMLHDALASLSVICELFGNEAELLIQDSDLAGAYLAMQSMADGQ